MCISSPFNGSLTIHQNDEETRSNEGFMVGGCLVVGNI